jgi:repressor LexA
MTVGERIIYLRDANGISQIELAKKIGVSKQNLYKYEKGIITNIPADKLEAIAKALNTTPSYLAGWDEKFKNFVQSEQVIDNILLDVLTDLTSEETIKVIAFVEGLKANR